jgi:ATP:ADP antiporter, AAA family
VSRFRRLVFINATYLFFAFGLLASTRCSCWRPAAVGERTGQVFYVWFSVFNLFATMLFWALMADRFSLEQSKRLFGAIAVGGTLGAIFGPWLASQLARPLGTPALLLVAAGSSCWRWARPGGSRACRSERQPGCAIPPARRRPSTRSSAAAPGRDSRR